MFTDTILIRGNLMVEILIILILGIVLYFVLNRGNIEIRSAGKKGEKLADKRIRSILKEDDYLLSNVNISENGRKTELDKVIINRNGLFIFEVKSHSGEIYGTVSDESWRKYKVSRGGNTYEKLIRNPIIQLKREINILANLLKENKIRVWVNGYVYMLNANSPVSSEYVLNYHLQIDRIIHTKAERELSEEKIKQIIALLEKENSKRTLKKLNIYKKR